MNSTDVSDEIPSLRITAALSEAKTGRIEINHNSSQVRQKLTLLSLGLKPPKPDIFKAKCVNSIST